MSDKTLTLSLARLPRALGSTLHEDIVWRPQMTWVPPRWRWLPARRWTSPLT